MTGRGRTGVDRAKGRSAPAALDLGAPRAALRLHTSGLKL